MITNRRDAVALLAGGGLSALSIPPSIAAAREAAPTSAPPPDKELMVPVEGGRVYVRVNGRLDAAKPPLMILHGGPGGSHSGYLPAIALSDERAVILYDQLDCGRSERPLDPANWTVPRYVSEIDAIRKALGVERLNVLGASWGGTLAAEYGMSRPAGLNSLVLASPLISTPRWIADANLLRRRLPLHVQTEINRCEAAGIPAKDPGCEKATRAFYMAFSSAELRPRYIAAYEQAMPRTFTPELYTTMWGGSEFQSTGTLKTYDAEARLGRIAAPTLYLSGEWDVVLPETARRFAARTPGAVSRVIPRASHSLQIDQPAAWLTELRGWLGRHDRA